MINKINPCNIKRPKEEPDEEEEEKKEKRLKLTDEEEPPSYETVEITENSNHGPSNLQLDELIIKDEIIDNPNDDEFLIDEETKASLIRHNEIEFNPIYCETCDKCYANNKDFALHSFIHNDDKLYSCHLCSKRSATKFQMKLHIKLHDNKGKFKCSICQKGFKCKMYADEHKNFHTGTRPFICNMCGKNFMFSHSLNIHRRKQHYETLTGTPLTKYDCPICKKHYKSGSGLRRHTMTKHNDSGIDTSVLCDICGKRIPKDKLVFHKRVHSGDKPHTCDFCSKSFTLKSGLVEHVRVHTGEKPFKCQYCNRGFTQRQAKLSHERRHTGERPFSCPFCKKGYISKKGLDFHVRGCFTTQPPS